MLTLTLLPLSALLAAAIATPTVQSVPLPGEMKPDFGTGNVWAETIWLPVEAPGISVRGRVSFAHEGASGKVEFYWIFQAQGGLPATLRQTVETSFLPTAVARRAATTDTLQIVGWSSRTGRVLVETWTLGQPILAAAAQPGQPTFSGMTEPTVTRVLEWISEPGQLPPVWDAAWQPHSERLLLLTHGTPPEVPTAIVSLDPSSGQWNVVCHAGVWPDLEGRRRIWLSRHPTGGAVALVTRRRPWDHGRAEPVPITDFVLRDSDGDGQFDFIGPLSREALLTLLPPPWDNKYELP